MSIESISASLTARASAVCAKADLGRVMRIRVDKKTVVSGVLVKAEPATPRVAGASMKCGFRVTLECGEAKVLRTFTVSELPVA